MQKLSSKFLKEPHVASFFAQVPLFLFLSHDPSETKLQRKEETLMATSYSLSMKRGSARSVNLIKKTGYLLALRNIVPPFTPALMCTVS